MDLDRPAWQLPDLGMVLDRLRRTHDLRGSDPSSRDRPVGSVHPARSREHLASAPPDAIVVAEARTPGMNAEVVTALADRGVAALVVALDEDAELPVALSAAGERHRLPILPSTGPSLDETVTALFEALLTAQRDRVDHTLGIHQRFSQIVRSGGGTGELLAALHDLVGHPVAVADRDGRVVSAHPHGTALGAPGATVSSRFDIGAGDLSYGDLLVMVPSEHLDLDSRVAIERAAMGIATHLAQAAAVAEANERFAALSLEQLISGHAGSVGEVVERAMSLGWDLTLPRAVLLASIDPPFEPTAVDGALNTIAAAARATLGAGAIVWRRSATIAALIDVVDDAPATRRELADSLRRELDQRVRAVSVSIGVGRRATSPHDLSGSFVEASRAVEVGRWAKGRHVTEIFDELGLERLLAPTPHDELAEFVHQTIGPLILHDREHGTELVESLRVWLEVRNLAAAARRLGVHYNTMRNRLDRVEDVIGPVLDRPAHVLECEVAVYIHRHHLDRATDAP